MVILVVCCRYSSALSIWLLILKVSLKGFSGMTLLPIPFRDPSKDAQQHHGWREFSLSLEEFSGVLPVLTNSDPHKRLPDFGWHPVIAALLKNDNNYKLGSTQSTIWFPCEPFFGAISFREYWIGLNTRIRSGKKLVNRSNNNGPDQIWPRFHEMSDWCGFCFEKGWTQTRVVTLKGVKQHVRM